MHGLLWYLGLIPQIRWEVIAQGAPEHYIYPKYHRKVFYSALIL